MGLRKQRLLDSLRVQQLFRDVEDEEAWIREKEPIAASTNRGRDLIGVQNLIKKHQAVLAEMHNHEPHVLAVCQAGFQMADDGHFAADEVRKRIQALADHWAHLKEKAFQRKQDLEDSLQAHQYFADANEAESWVKEKEPLSGSIDYGKDEDSSEALLKKHEALMSDLEAFGSTIVALREQAQSCPVKKNFVLKFRLFLAYHFLCVYSKKPRFLMFLARSVSLPFMITPRSHPVKSPCAREMFSLC